MRVDQQQPISFNAIWRSLHESVSYWSLNLNQRLWSFYVELLQMLRNSLKVAKKKKATFSLPFFEKLFARLLSRQKN